ncbi:MAG TPA: toxin-antitoxin system HicB family antitoxin [bacterium]|nr:toxin-antitoxin system HicB family antitoxin [bacterium]
MKKEKNPLSYKGYHAAYRYDKETSLFHGEVTGIEDVITFQATREEDMEQAFRDSIDDYLAFRKSLKRSNKDPENLPGQKAVRQTKKLRS